MQATKAWSCLPRVILLCQRRDLDLVFLTPMAVPSPRARRAVAVCSDEWQKAWLWSHALLTSTADFFYEQRNWISVRCRIRYVLQYSLQIAHWQQLVTYSCSLAREFQKHHPDIPSDSCHLQTAFHISPSLTIIFDPCYLSKKSRLHFLKTGNPTSHWCSNNVEVAASVAEYVDKVRLK